MRFTLLLVVLEGGAAATSPTWYAYNCNSNAHACQDSNEPCSISCEEDDFPGYCTRQNFDTPYFENDEIKIFVDRQNRFTIMHDPTHHVTLESHFRVDDVVAEIPTVPDSDGVCKQEFDFQSVFGYLVNNYSSTAEYAEEYCQAHAPYVIGDPWCSVTTVQEILVLHGTLYDRQAAFDDFASDTEIVYQMLFNPSTIGSMTRMSFAADRPDPPYHGINPRCYYAADNGKCDMNTLLPPLSFGYRTVVKKNPPLGNYGWPTETFGQVGDVWLHITLAVSQSDVSLRINGNAITECTDLAVTDAVTIVFSDETTFAYQGPTQYTDYFMEENNVSTSYTFETMRICPVNASEIVVRYQFRNISELKAFAYDPSVSYVMPQSQNDVEWVVVLVIVTACILLCGCILRSVRFELSAH